MLLLWIALPLSAEVIASYGYGIPLLPSNVQAQGMGCIGIGLADLYLPSSSNPAGLSAVLLTRIGFQYNGQEIKITEGNATTRENLSNFDGFTFTMPLGKGLVVQTGLNAVTKADYGLKFNGETGVESYSQTVEGHGGLNRFHLSAGWTAGFISFGASYQYHFGKIREEWIVDYQNTFFSNADHVFSTKTWGSGWKLGVLIKPAKRLTFGATWSPSVDLTNRTDITRTYLNTTEIIKNTIKIPGAWGVGASYRVKSLGRLVGDYYVQDWSLFEAGNKTQPFLKKELYYSAGMEFYSWDIADAPYWKRMAWRFGFSYHPMFVNLGNKDLVEKSVSIGMGFPLFANVARIDLAFSIGRRDLDGQALKETVYRFTAGFTGSERWFYRGL
jgi:hypothetical protein